MNYENVPKHPQVIEIYEPLSITDALKQANKEELEYIDYRVEQMHFPRKGQEVSTFNTETAKWHRESEKEYMQIFGYLESSDMTTKKVLKIYSVEIYSVYFLLFTQQFRK